MKKLETLKVAQSGQVITEGEWVVEDGIKVELINGKCTITGNGSVIQRGGFCWAGSTGVVFQFGGKCLAGGNSTVYQKAGYCAAMGGELIEAKELEG